MIFSSSVKKSKTVTNNIALIALAVFVCLSTAEHANAAKKKNDESKDSGKLEAVVMLSRHGVRAPLKDNEWLDRETKNTWPKWDVAPGIMTTRGRKLMVKMGGYYRDQFTRDGLLTGNDQEDVKHAYFHTNTIQRTFQTGCALAEGLFPSTTTTVYRLNEGQQDKVYHGAPRDKEIQAAAIDGRIGDNAEGLMDSLKPQIDLIEKTLNQPGLYTRKLSSLGLAAGMADSYMLEYCEGLPMKDVAFGRANEAELQEMFKVLATDFDLKVRTPYVCRQIASNLVSHISSTLQQVASAKTVDGAFGDADDKIYVIVGHDTTISSVAGLLNLDWVFPDTGRNLCPPGGAIVFELRSRPAKDGEAKDFFVQAYYAAETLKQMRENADLSLENPPAIAPLWVPGSSTTGPGYESPLADFRANVDKIIDPKLVFPIDDGDQKKK